MGAADVTYFPPPRAVEQQPDDARVCTNSVDRIKKDIGRELTHLSTANKNRVLLTISEIIAQQLEALETDTTS